MFYVLKWRLSVICLKNMSTIKESTVRKCVMKVYICVEIRHLESTSAVKAPGIKMKNYRNPDGEKK